MPDKEYCIYCGTTLVHNSDCTNPCCKPKERQFCGYCGNRCVQGVVFCMSCGEPFAEMELDHSLLTSVDSYESVNLFKVEDEELARYAVEDVEVDAVAQRKLPKMGVGTFLKNAIGQAAQSADEFDCNANHTTDTAQEEHTESKPVRTKVKPKVRHENKIAVPVDLKEENIPIVEAVQSNTANIFSAFEQSSDAVLSKDDDSMALESKLEFTKSEQVVTWVSCKTFIPKYMCVGSYIYTAKPMALVVKFKPVIPRAVTVGLS